MTSGSASRLSSLARAASSASGVLCGIDAGAGVEPRHAPGWPLNCAAEVERLVHLGRTFADADGEHRAHAGLGARCEHGLAVVVRSAGCRGGRGNRSANEPPHVIAAESACPVRVACYFSRAPSGTSSRKPASTGAPSGREPASSMPFDSRPRILRGARLATMTILRPMSFSGS